MLLEGKVALVTGGAQGIGKAIATCLAQNGADVAICDVNLEVAEKTAKELESLGRATLALKVDVTKTAEVDDMLNKVIDKFKKIDILINNAGITRDNLLLRMKEDDWDAVLSVNLKGAFLVTKAASKYMVKQHSGKIVNIASIIGIMGNSGQVNYAASKGGVIALTKSVAKELASRNVCVNAIAPGFIQTEMTSKLPPKTQEAMLAVIPLKRFGKPEDVAQVCLFLASERSSYITGQTIVIDGGMVM